MNETKNENIPKKGILGQDQFKSTKKWNEIIESFYNNMPLKRHWKNFRTFNDCFTASEAIEWTYRYLRSSPNFQHLTITKTNAVKLLQIFLKERIIEDVRAGENCSFKEFQDDDRIYKFCSTNPIFLKRNCANFNLNSTKNGNFTESQNTSEKNYSKNEKSSTEAENTSNVQKQNLNTNKDKFLNSTSLDNLSSFDKNFIRRQNSISLLKNCDICKKDGSSEVFAQNSIEFEIWSKSARKILESVIRKAYLHKNSSVSIKIDKNIHGQESENNDCVLTPKLSSTLKRSTDIKIGLTNILSKKSSEIISKIAGSNIEHNMNNINKHGVVINTEDDLPVWVIRAMHTLLNWKSDNNSEYPKFSDVFEEIAQYFNSMGEPLLTIDLSYAFMEVLSLMTTKSSDASKQIKNEQFNFENFIVNSNLNEEKKSNFCLNYRILDMIVSSFDQILTETNVHYDTEFLIDNIEKHLLENARLNIFEDPDDDFALFEQTENSRYREEIYYNLLIDSLARLENCCSNCRNIHTEINQFIKKNECQSYQAILNCANSNENLDLKRLKSDFNESILESIHSSKTRLHRNNSFKAAIGDKIDSNSEANLAKKPFVIRTSTNNSNDFNFVRSFINKGEIILNDDECDNFDLAPYEKNTESFALVQNCMDTLKTGCMTKSISNQNLGSVESTKLTRKRKLSSDESNVDKLALIFTDLASDGNKKNKLKSSKFTSSLSLSYFNKDDIDSKKLYSSLSLQHVSGKDNVKRNLNDLNVFIKKSLNKHVHSDNDPGKIIDQGFESAFKLNTTIEIDNEIFDCLIASFRLLAVMLPPSNKRKLHFLLRFLNRLKANEHLEYYALNLNKPEDFVDVSGRSANSSKFEKCQTNSAQVESLLISTFLKSIISSKDCNQYEILATKVVQILINNYSDIMRIPNDLITSFKTRLKNSNSAWREKSSIAVNNEKEFLNKVENLPKFSQELKYEKKSFRNFIENTDIKQSQSKKSSVNSSQQNQKIKKALNILGLNDSISYPSLNQKHETDKLTKDNILTASLSENISKNNQINFEQSFSQLQSTSCLNSSVISNYPSKSSLFQSSSSINFPRIFSNKKWKKENLI